MRGKLHAPSDHVVTMDFWGALRRRGLTLILATLTAGGLTFFALWLFEPSATAFPNNGPLVPFVMLLTLIFGATGALKRALLSAVRGRHAQTPQFPLNNECQANGLNGSKAKRAQTTELLHPVLEEGLGTEASEPVCNKGETVGISSVARLAHHLRAHALPEGGFRTLISGATDGIDPSVEGLALADELSCAGLQVIVIDWSLDEMGFAHKIGLSTRPGFTDLVNGVATFEDVIHSLQNSQVQVIPSGSSLRDVPVNCKPDSQKLNLLLDALDEVYDQVIVIGKLVDARALFEDIEGRFDAGVTISAESPTRRDPPNTFLDYEVVDIVLVRYLRLGDAAQAAKRLARSVGTWRVAASL